MNPFTEHFRREGRGDRQQIAWQIMLLETIKGITEWVEGVANIIISSFFIPGGGGVVGEGLPPKTT